MNINDNIKIKKENLNSNFCNYCTENDFSTLHLCNHYLLIKIILNKKIIEDYNNFFLRNQNNIEINLSKIKFFKEIVYKQQLILGSVLNYDSQSNIINESIKNKINDIYLQKIKSKKKGFFSFWPRIKEYNTIFSTLTFLQYEKLYNYYKCLIGTKLLFNISKNLSDNLIFLNENIINPIIWIKAENIICWL